DPRRVNALKHLAGEAGVRPGDLVRQWVEERLDASRGGAETTAAEPRGESLLNRLEALVARVSALEDTAAARQAEPDPAPVEAAEVDGTGEDTEATEPPVAEPTNQISAVPSGDRVALHDEMIAVILERGPLSAGELAVAIIERGRYAAPRSGKALDAKTVSQRVSNPTYRARFVRRDGKIALADEA
ncbi:MAG: hypothetical protein M3473_05390, partial [Chloroflexota bacterium]|nr:hypothetical protein [Chloroflexota bacterium]